MRFVTPVSQIKSNAMTRVLDLVSRGYTRRTEGTVDLMKLESFVRKMHHKYAVGATSAQRMKRKAQGLANAYLVLYTRAGDETVQWLLLATLGTGLEGEAMEDVTEKRLYWLGYELVRYAKKGRLCWTWRRIKTAQQDFYMALDSSLRQKHFGAVERLLKVAAHQPGFHGVREQNKTLFSHAVSHGYTGPLPHLFYIQKMSHGEPLLIS